jgi:hypothetical protein
MCAPYFSVVAWLHLIPYTQLAMAYARLDFNWESNHSSKKKLGILAGNKLHVCALVHFFKK